MIREFKHKGLQRFFETEDVGGIQPPHAGRLKLILARLNAAFSPQDMNLPGLKLHPLKGSRKGGWAVSVSGNWRVTFAFEGEHAIRVNYEDYH